MAVSRLTKKQGYNQGRRFWRCPRDRDQQHDYFVWIDPDPRVASPSAAGPETLPALPAAYQQLLQGSIHEVVRQVLQALSLNQDHGPPPPAATRRRDRQVEGIQLPRPEGSEGEDAVEW